MWTHSFSFHIYVYIFMLAKADVFVAFIRYVFPEVPIDKLITSQKDIP